MSDFTELSVPSMTRRGFMAVAGAAAAMTLVGCHSMSTQSLASLPRKKAIYKKLFGTMPDGTKIYQYTLTNANGMVLQMISYGARIQRIMVPDAKGNIGDVVLGYENLEGYMSKADPYFGATIGRYANRIARGTFTLDGKTYHIPANDGPNALHGGPNAFDRQAWEASEVSELGEPGLRFRMVSPAMSNGFPGNLVVDATHVLTANNEIVIHYRAATDAPTVLNLTNHAYFNLNGPGTDVLNHMVTINANKYTPTDNEFIPTGKNLPVAGTPFDFRKPVELGSRIKPFPAGSKANFDLFPYGYDNNWCLNNHGSLKAIAARVACPANGRVLECRTTQPGVQFYTGNFLNGTIDGIGGKYPVHGALTLETQHYPDSPNEPAFPSTVLRPGQKFYQSTHYKFYTM